MADMRILALETSTEHGSCALWCAGEVLQRACPAGEAHSETLLPLLAELLAEGQLSLPQIDAIAFGCGPGAFTGLRVACGVAQGLAVAADLPVLPVVSLEAMAAASGAESVLSLLDARMHEVYCAHYRRVAADDYQLLGDIHVLPPQAVGLPAGTGAACGNALRAYPELQQRIAQQGWVMQPDILPEARWLAHLAVPRLRAGAGIDAADAAPLYIRDKVAKTVAERLREGGKA